MQVLDSISPLARIKLSAELADKVKLLSGDVAALQRVSATARVAAILRELGAGEKAPQEAPQGADTDFPIKEAASSYSGISHSGNARAKGDAEDYEKTISQAVEEARPLAETDAQRAAMASEEAAFRADYLSQYRSLMGVRAGTYSGHVAGRSSLNSKQANARNSALDKAMDRFYGWVKAQAGRIKTAVLAARNPEQLAAAQAIKDAEQSVRDAKAAEAAQKNVDFMVKLLTFKSGDKLPSGSATITKVSKTREGVPSTLTFVMADGTKPYDDKIDVLRVFYRGDKARLTSDFVAAMALLQPATEGATGGAAEGSIEEQIESLLAEYLSLQRQKYTHTMSYDLRGAEVAAQYALDDMRVAVRRNTETAGGAAMALEVLADEVAYSKEKITKMLQEEAEPFDASKGGRSPSGGVIGLNGEFYKGGSFLPRTTLPKQGAAGASAGASKRGVLIEPGVFDFPPSAEAKSILAGYSQFIHVTDGVAKVFERPDAAIESFVNADVAEGRAFLRAAADAYNAGMRWYVPGEIVVTEENRVEPQREIIEHATKGGKGKIIRGIVRTDLSYAEAKAIDEYTFKKDGGWFIREKHLAGYKPDGAGAAPAVVKPELTPEQQAQEAADRLADEQLKEQLKRQVIADKLREAGQATIEKAEQELGADRQTNTRRRADMASSILARHEQARAIGKTMQNLAEAIASGEAQHLAGITSRAAVETLHERLVQGMYEYDKTQNLSYSEQQRQKGRPATEADARYATIPMPMWGSAGTSLAKVLEAIKGKKGSVELAKKIRFTPGPDAEILRALKAMISAKDFDYVIGWWNIQAVAKAERLRRAGIATNEQLRAALGEYLQYREGARTEDPIKKAERAIIGQKVGIDFFPTPVATASRMADLARIGKGDRVLEPSAGNGNLADAARAKGAEVDVLEISSQLRDILKAKGYNVVDHDFESFSPAEKYDAVIMNPPFSSRKDAEHIQRAFTMLKPGGRLVAIAGEGVFFGSDAKAVQFREWLDSHGADVEQLEQNTFKDKNLLATTGANGRLIVLTK